MRDWISFWDSDHSIYVSARHVEVHYRTIADMIVRHVPAPDAVVLDFGCGEAKFAEAVADGERIKKALRRMLMGAVAGVDDGDVQMACDKISSASGTIATSVISRSPQFSPQRAKLAFKAQFKKAKPTTSTSPLSTNPFVLWFNT